MDKAVKDALSLNEDQPVTKENILKLTKLVTTKAEITDLSGLEYATNLTTVTFTNENITSLKPLAGLDKLNSAGFTGNSNLPMSEVLSLKKLTALELSNIKYSQDDFTKLSQYSQMTDLRLTHCRVQNLDFARSMPNLDLLYIADNNISSLEPLENCNSLRGLIVYNNKLTNLKGVNSNKLVVLDAVTNNISDTSAATMPNVKSIKLKENNLTSIDLTKCPTLAELDLTSNPLESITAGKLSDLTFVDLYDTKIKNVGFLEQAPNIDQLEINSSSKISLRPYYVSKKNSWSL